MKSEPHIQHLQIIDRIKSKYGSKPSLKVCQHFVNSKVENITEPICKDIMQKFVSYYGMKKSYDDDELVMLILMCITVQKGGNLKEIDQQAMVKLYRGRNLILKGSKGKEKGGEDSKLVVGEKEEGKERGDGKGTKVTSVQEVEPIAKTASNGAATIEPKLSKTSSQEVSITSIGSLGSKKQSTDEVPLQKRQKSNRQDQIEIPLDGMEQAKKKQSSTEQKTVVSEKPQQKPLQAPIQKDPEPKQPEFYQQIPIVREISQQQQAKQPPRKFSFGSNKEIPPQQQFQKSISVKMAPQLICVDSINQQTVVSTVDTPTFLKKGSQTTNRFFQSQLQLSTRAVPSSSSQPHKPPQITIDRYIKQTQYLSTVVRYSIKTANDDHPPVFRRYSEFLKLQTYLRQKNKGIIIPELPPKESVVASLWATSEATLMERKKGLEEFLNKCLGHEVIGRDPLVLRFIDDPNLEQANYNQDSLVTTAEKYIHSLWNITASTEQLKDYGMAYFSYIKNSSSQDTMSDGVSEIFKYVMKELEKVTALKDYVDKMEVIQAKRNKIEAELDLAVKRPAGVNTFKKDLERIIIEFSQAKKTYDDFCALKNNKIWLEHLYGAKINKADQEKLAAELRQAEQKIEKVTPLLEKEMTEFLHAKIKNWPQLLNNLCIWKAKMQGV